MCEGRAAMSEAELKFTVDGMRYRVLGEPAQEPALILLHGWGGDAEAMWVFQRTLPAFKHILAPQAPYAVPEGGYEWIGERSSRRAASAAFRPGVEILRRFLQRTLPADRLTAGRFLLLGFSQGAALAFAAVQLGLLRPAGIAALAGFLPPGDDAPLAKIPVFWAHGLQDDIIPFEQAANGAERLRAASAGLTFCESRTAHKIDRRCLGELKTWLENTSRR